MNVLITGSSSGIGKSLADYYLHNETKVIGISRNEPESFKRNNNYRHYKADFSNPENLKDKIKPALEGVKKLDLVVLNAGVLNKVADMKDCSLEEIKHVMDINVWANKIIIDEITDKVDKTDQIVAISSGAAVSGNRGWNAYSLSKATLNMLVELYSTELKNTHISALAPGIIDTSMQDYISSIGNVDNYPTIQRLQKAKGTSDMPSPEKVAPNIADAINRLRQYPTGSFADIRKM